MQFLKIQYSDAANHMKSIYNNHELNLHLEFQGSILYLISKNLNIKCFCYFSDGEMKMLLHFHQYVIK